MNLRRIAKSLLFPIVPVVRAYRDHLKMKNWRENVKGGKIDVQLTTPKGTFTVDVRSGLSRVAFDGKYEEGIMRLLSDLRIGDGFVVNIGANIGFYAVHLARVFPTRRILAIEPNPEAFGLLKKNVVQNHLEERIDLVNACVSGSDEKVEFSIINGKPEYSSIGEIVHASVQDQPTEVINVDSVRLTDVLGEKKVALVFMDIEGAEEMVLRDSEEVLLRDRPTILCECDTSLLQKFDTTSTQLIEYLERLGYRVTDARRGGRTIEYPFDGDIIAKYEG